MRTALVLAAIFSLLTVPGRAYGVADPCTVVAVEMIDKVNSADARPGDFFRFQTVNAVTRGNQIVIPARTVGYGIVAIASPAGRGGRAGTLVLEPRYLEMPDHTHLGIVLNHNTAGLQRSGSSGNVPGYLGAIPVPGVGAAIGVFNYFHNGKNIIVERGTVFTVFPSDNPSVERCQEHPSY
ncbi:MAG TPA: hypothetical protein VGN11_07345 [Candidatus Baltobacteraceae bacterium]|nr:hypothetical protein [Candidatus Baltobacteraceae bacterium]